MGCVVGAWGLFVVCACRVFAMLSCEGAEGLARVVFGESVVLVLFVPLRHAFLALFDLVQGRGTQPLRSFQVSDVTALYKMILVPSVAFSLLS